MVSLMSESEVRFSKAPIVEAVLDIECDMPPGHKLASLEGVARDCFRDRYPKFRAQFLQEHKIETKPDQPPQLSVRRDVQALQFLQEDEKQLVQVRMQGFSFNRLAPYGGLDDYLPEIEHAWRLFIKIASPAQVRAIRLRYINRILLPLAGGNVQLDDYLKVAPHLPDEKSLTFTGFLNQHSAVEIETGHQVNLVLTTQPSEGEYLPLIFDNSVAAVDVGEPENWPWIVTKIQALRILKNRIFRNTLTEKCQNLFQ